MTSQSADILIIGGGLVGLATAYTLLQQNPRQTLIVVEKENTVGQHQSSTNSGVLHSGIYYKPDTYRAQFCRSGKAMLEAFCTQESIPFDRCGKVIVAINESEFAGLDTIYQRGLANGVSCRMVDDAELKEIEPHTAGLRAIHVPEAGIVDYLAVCHKFQEKIEAMGSRVITGCRVTAVSEHHSEVTITTTKGTYTANQLISCAGLHSDRVAKLANAAARDVQIVPFRGEYYELTKSARHLCNGLIYPVPDPRFPFLGVHFTRMIDGNVECGPNAVLAWAREGYRRRDINATDLWEAITFPGMQTLAKNYWRNGAEEVWRSFNKAAFVTALQKLIPDIQANQLIAAPAGVRATALTAAGTIVDDFAFTETAKTLHVVNAPSPAATACLSIGQHIAKKIQAKK